MVCEACGFFEAQLLSTFVSIASQHIPTSSWIWERESMENTEPFMKILETALLDSVESRVLLTAPEPAWCRLCLLRGLHPAIS